jgi:hypothetical protein
MVHVLKFSLTGSRISGLKDGQRFAAIKKVEIVHSFTTRPCLLTESPEFLSKCPSLRHFIITMPRDELYCTYEGSIPIAFPHWTPRGRVLTCAEMMDKFEMPPLLDCKAMQQFTFKIRDLRFVSVYDVLQFVIITFVAEWIKQLSMEKSGRVIETNLIRSKKTG